jgi:hypothetical protein
VLESVMNLICLHSSEFYFACHSFFMSYYACACCFHLIKFRADEELVDQKKYLEDSCKPKCVKPLLEYEVKHFHNLICHFFFPAFLFSKHANEYHSWLYVFWPLTYIQYLPKLLIWCYTPWDFHNGIVLCLYST